MASNDNHEMLHHLTIGDKQVVLIGTAHVSKESSELVAAVIQDQRPDTVCVELCASRYDALRQKDRWQNTDIIQVVKEKKAFLLLSNLLLTSFQRRIAQKLDVTPGQEMIQAIQSAEAVGAEIHLADRDIRVTLSRTWRIMGLWDKIKLIFQLLLSLGSVDEISEADIERMKQEDVLTSLLSDIAVSLPVVKRILIDERDQYLAAKIESAPGKNIVAVVGAGHVPGIKENWGHSVDLEALESLPPRGKLLSVFKWGLPAAICALFLLGFFWGGAATGSDMLVWWILANGLLAGLGALIALAHPLTIAASVLAAPLTSLNPAIAAGWVSGLVEAFTRKPQVKDLEHLPEDILSVRGFWRNKVTRILLVVVFTNLGSAVGTFVAIPLMVRLLHAS